MMQTTSFGVHACYFGAAIETETKKGREYVPLADPPHPLGWTHLLHAIERVQDGLRGALLLMKAEEVSG